MKYDKSPIAKMFPKAPIHPDVDVRSGYRVWDVARATLADMYLTAPMWLEDPAGGHPKELFITGAMNISPIELALSLGDEVMAIRMRELRASNPAEKIESYVYEDTFGFTNDERRIAIKNRFGDKVIWIDLKGIEEMEKKNGFSPLRVGDGSKMHLKDNIPADPVGVQEAEQGSVGMGRRADHASRPSKERRLKQHAPSHDLGVSRGADVRPRSR